MSCHTVDMYSNSKYKSVIQHILARNVHEKLVNSIKILSKITECTLRGKYKTCVTLILMQGDQECTADCFPAELSLFKLGWKNFREALAEVKFGDKDCLTILMFGKICLPHLEAGLKPSSVHKMGESWNH